MEQLKLSTKVLLVSASILLFILVTGPMGYKFGLVPLQPSLVSLLIALVGGALSILVALVYLVIAIKNDLGRNRNHLVLVVALGLIPVVVMVPQMNKAFSVPPIHDITTDTANPPVFGAIKALRADAPNGVDYGGAFDEWPAEKIAAAQLSAYPEIKPIFSSLSVADAVNRSEQVLTAMELEIVNVDATSGLVEATATTFWFGFKDDVVIRIVPTDEGTRIDLRSMSRLGQGDVGANAARISDFISRFES